MLGWHIIIKQNAPEECDKAANQVERVLARWEAGLYGLTWLEELAKAGKADKILHNGYPIRYRVLAKDVLPLIMDGPPPAKIPNAIGGDSRITWSWIARVDINKEKIAQCPLDFLLTIDAWDLS